MPLIKKPVTGMKDILPSEMAIRDYVIRLVKETYGKFGFQSIETPCVEHIENLCSKQGGENEKLIFKVMKRGEKFDLTGAQNENDLCDSGLRYDLTLPLSRYYANNQANLMTPFKALQMGNVFRADRPQKGRFRQFMQCDIDILGEPTDLAEIELITATTTLLSKLGFSDFTVRINDRRILKAMAAYCGFAEESYDEVFIILDKMDKIGTDGVRQELTESGFDANAADRYMQLFSDTTADISGIKQLSDTLGDKLPEGTAEGLCEIISTVDAARRSDFNVEFDPTLVRGMSYYTGTIFEIEMKEFGSSVAGGGRYDGMIGRFTGMDTPACGFSIGFERIITILMDKGFKIPDEEIKTAYLVEKNMTAEKLKEIMKEAAALREEGKTVLVTRMAKNRKFQKDALAAEGYGEFRDRYNEK